MADGVAASRTYLLVRCTSPLRPGVGGSTSSHVAAFLSVRNGMPGCPRRLPLDSSVLDRRTRSARRIRELEAGQTEGEARERAPGAPERLINTRGAR